MREQMNAATSARVLLGGQVTGFKGKYPGLLEEALTALRSGKPLYLIGGFGGCTRAIIEALKGGVPEELTEGSQSRDPLYADVVARYQTESKGLNTTPINYALEREFLRTKGVAGLNNGLGDDENEILFKTTNLPELVYLILKGLTKATA